MTFGILLEIFTISLSVCTVLIIMSQENTYVIMFVTVLYLLFLVGSYRSIDTEITIFGQDDK